MDFDKIDALNCEEISKMYEQSIEQDTEETLMSWVTNQYMRGNCYTSSTGVRFWSGVGPGFCACGGDIFYSAGNCIEDNCNGRDPSANNCRIVAACGGYTAYICIRDCRM